MKNILFIVVCLGLSHLKAQPNTYTLKLDTPMHIPAGAYCKDNMHLMDKFVGTWIGEQNGKKLILNLYIVPDSPIGDYFCDELFGSYVYYENGVELVNTTSYTGENALVNFVFWGPSNDTTMVNDFYDPGRPKLSSKLTLTYSTSPPVERLHWSLSVVGIYPTITTEPAPILTHRVPMEFDLVKH